MMTRFCLLAAIATSLLACSSTPPPEGRKLVKVKENPDKSQVFYFRNGASCLKRADYTRFSDAKGTLAIKDLFNASGSYQAKMEKAKELSPQFQELERASSISATNTVRRE